VQAAAALHGRWPDWKLADGEIVEPEISVDHAAIRERYRRVAS